MLVRSGSLTRSLMLICRSPGHLLFSEWTIRQRTLSVRAEAHFRSCSVFQPPGQGHPWPERVGKSSGPLRILQERVSNLSTPLSYPSFHSPLRGCFKERFVESGCKFKPLFETSNQCVKNYFTQRLMGCSPQPVTPCRCRGNDLQGGTVQHSFP